MLGHHTALRALRAGHKVIVEYRNLARSKQFRTFSSTPDRPI
jgi:hypothetical protein